MYKLFPAIYNKNKSHTHVRTFGDSNSGGPAHVETPLTIKLLISSAALQVIFIVPSSVLDCVCSFSRDTSTR